MASKGSTVPILQYSRFTCLPALDGRRFPMQPRTRPPQLVERWSLLPNVGGVRHLPRVLCQSCRVESRGDFQVCSAFTCARDLLTRRVTTSRHEVTPSALRLHSSCLRAARRPIQYTHQAAGAKALVGETSFFRWGTS